MIKHGQRMSQALADMHLNELKMNDPKLNKVFDKLKPKATVQLKTSSTIAKGEDFKTYLVVSKNTLRNGVEKITLKNRANPTGVKSFLYRRDGKVTFAIGDMGASIDDIKEKYSLINHEIIEEIEVEEIEEAIDPADLDLDATDADKKAADKNIIMQMRKAMDVRGNMPIEFANGKKEKVDAKILDMMTKAHMNIQKPRDKDKFVAMISKSKRDMLNVAKKLATLKMGEELELDEKFQSRRPSSKEVKMAIGIANDPRYKQGNYSGAVKAIEKIRDGLSDYPEVAAALKKANENLDEGKMKDLLIKAQDLMGPSKNREQGIEFVMKGLKVSKKEATKLVDAVIKMSEEVELTEAKISKELAIKILSMRKDKKFVKVSGDFVPTIYLSGNDKDALKKEFGKLPRGLPSATSGMSVVSMINYALGSKDGRDPIDTEDGDSQSPKLISWNRGGKVIGKPRTVGDAVKIAGLRLESVELDEKYDLYHKSFSDAMQHAYDYAKKKMGITVDPKEIDNKVATGPKKPSEGKTNKYRLKGKGGNLQIQVYNKGGSKPFELNMYKEENEMTKSLKDTIVEMWSEAVSPAQQAAIAISKKEKEQDEGNAFGAALQAARENGDETFVVSGKTYKCEDYDEKGQVKEAYKPVKANHYDVKVTVSDKDVAKVKKIISNFNGDIEDVDSDQVDGGGNKFKGTGDIYIQGDDAGKLGMEIAKSVRTVKVMGETNKNDKSDDGDGMDAVQPKAVKKKFKDRKDKDIDNDGDVDDTDKFLHKRRKAISKSINSQKEV